MRHKAGFTLVEILIVMAIVGSIAATVYIALDPLHRFADARNSQRYLDVNAILGAVNLYTIDHKNEPFPEIDGALRMIGTASDGCAVTCGSLSVVGTFDENYFKNFVLNSKHLIDNTFSAKASPLQKSPEFKEAFVKPEKVQVGDIMTVEVVLRDASGIRMVKADMGGIETIDLNMVDGDIYEGIWRAEWLVHDTVQKSYITTVSAENLEGKIAKTEIEWFDPVSGWISPDGFLDPGNQWTNEANAYDGNSGTYATNAFGGAGWGQYIILTLSTPVTSDRLKVNVDYLDVHIQEVDVDVYKDGAWEDVFQGGNEADWNVKWVELSFSKGEVSQIRFRYNYKVGGYYYWMYETQIYQTSSTIFSPVCEAKPATSIRANSALLQAGLISDGGEPCDYRFQYGVDTSFQNATDWVNGEAYSGNTVKKSVVGLNGFTHYYFRGQIRNSVSTVNCNIREFTTEREGAGWAIPVSYNDPDNKWEYETRAMDDDTSSFGRSYHYIGDPAWSSFIYFNHPGMNSDKLRLYALYNSETNAVDVDIYKDGVWVDVFQGAFADRSWVEYAYTEGSVTQARVRFFTNFTNRGFFFELYDFQFWDLGDQNTGAIMEDECVDLGSHITPGYLKEIPYDPRYGSPERTYYAIKREFDNKKITVVACKPELGVNIQLTH